MKYPERQAAVRSVGQELAGCAFCLLLLAHGALAAEKQSLTGHVPLAVTKLSLRPLDHLPAARQLHLGIGLPLRNQPELTQLLRQIYDPGSRDFHRYLTPQQFTERFGPTAQDYQAVVDFASSHGFTVTHTHPGRILVDVEAPAEAIEKALHVKLLVYQHPTEARTFFAPGTEPALDLNVPVLSISGLDNYTLPHSHLASAGLLRKGKAPTANIGSDTTGNYIGNDFRHAYVPGTALTGAGQTVGLLSFEGYTPSDIEAYKNRAHLISNVPVVPLLFGRSSNSPGPGDSLEISLDIEMSISMAPGLSNVVVFEGADLSYTDSMFQEMSHPTQGEPLPLQISTSFIFHVDGTTLSFLQKFASQGQSFFYASGDSGAYTFDPLGGSTDEPYMTLVGGTDLTMDQNAYVRLSESAWSGSSGGILTNVPIPFYQLGLDMSRNQGSTQHRNAPDVAMVAANVEIIATILSNNVPLTGLPQAVDGTSIAAPLWAGFAALMNQQAASEGVPSVGFLNPAFYYIGRGSQYASCFNDITNGNNTWSGSPAAYYAVPGYDLVTGWGTPKGTNLINALLAFGTPVWVDFNYLGALQNGSFDEPFKTLGQGIVAVPSAGTIFIKSAGFSSETITNSKPVTIGAYNGAATIGP